MTTIAGTALAAGSADGTGSAARFDHPTSVAVDSSGNLYIADSGNDTIRKITPSGVVSTVIGTPGVAGFQMGSIASATLDDPVGVAFYSGVLYILEQNSVLSASGF